MKKLKNIWSYVMLVIMVAYLVIALISAHAGHYPAATYSLVWVLVIYLTQFNATDECN